MSNSNETNRFQDFFDRIFQDPRQKETQIVINHFEKTITDLENQIAEYKEAIQRRLVLNDPQELAEVLNNFVSDWGGALENMGELQKQVKQLERENQQQAIRIEALEKENTSLRENYSQQMQQLVKQNTDNIINSDLSQEYTPDRAHSAFRSLLSSKIQDVVSRAHTYLKLDERKRRENDRLLKAIISNNVLFEGCKLLQRQLNDSEVRNSIVKGVQAEFAENLQKEIYDYNAIGLDLFIDEALEVLHYMTANSDSISILFPSEGTLFDKNLHETVKGSGETGSITYSVLPGLMIKGKAVIKSEVYIAQ